MKGIPNDAVKGLPGSEFGGSFLDEYRRATAEVHTDVLELDDVIEQVFIAMLADGHAILEGEPGVGKTLLAVTFARTVDAECKRIQFTADTKPEDLFYSLESFGVSSEEGGRKISEAVLGRGPLFCDILIGDEVNRAAPKVHSGLLEVLEERRITLEGVTHDLGNFYFHVATQNPVETAESTYELPEALRERYLLMVHVSYPMPELLRKIAVHDTRPKQIDALLKKSRLVEAREAIFDEYVLSRDRNDPVISYIQRLITSLHDHPATQWGPGIRAAQDLTRAAAVHAFLHGRSRITFSDVQKEAGPALRFKFARKLRVSRELGIRTNDELIAQTMARVPIAGV